MKKAVFVRRIMIAAACLGLSCLAHAQTHYAVVISANQFALPYPTSPANFTALPPVTLPPGVVVTSVEVSGWCNDEHTQVGYVTLPPIHSGGGGTGQTRDPVHAILWVDGVFTADLQNQQNDSVAGGCDGNMQVGTAGNGVDSGHAVIWFGTAKSELDINSGPYLSTTATSVKGNTQVGGGTLQVRTTLPSGIEQIRSHTHALVWHGTANSLVDIHPAGPYLDSFATAADELRQFGYATVMNAAGTQVNTHGFVWAGAAASAVDLHQFLPQQYVSSQPFYLDPASGVITGYIYTAPGTTGLFAQWIPQ